MFSEYKKDTVLVRKIQIQIDILDLKKKTKKKQCDYH